jgi:hypothetical protein
MAGITFRLEVHCDNAAFDDPYEMGEILRSLANTTDYGTAPQAGALCDSNGNTVGTWSWS